VVDLDLAVWELRRYCQVLNVFGKVLQLESKSYLMPRGSDLVASNTKPRHKFRLANGLLEKILDEKKHPSRSALLWHNPCFGVRARATILAKSHLSFQNPLLYVYPEMLDELVK
jgi:hypothetical protein